MMIFESAVICSAFFLVHTASVLNIQRLPNNTYNEKILSSTHKVTSPPKFKEQPSWPHSTYYDEFGPPISVSCDLVPEDGTTLLWFKESLLLKSSSTLVIDNNNQTLTLAYPVQNQTGSFKCLAFNSAGNISHTGYIFISARRQETRPRVVVTDPDNLVKHAKVGDNVTISCTFDIGGSTTGLLDFNSNWQKENQSVNDTNHTTWNITETRSNNQIISLVFHSFKPSDYGSYKCIGMNHKGNDSKLVSIVPPEHSKGKLPVTVIIVVGISSTVIIFILTITSILVHRYRRIRKYQSLEWEEPDVGKYDVPKYKLRFDVFVSYSHADLLWVKDTLFKSMLDRSYEVCLDFKDFVPGMATSENIVDAIYTSRKTIVLMSKHFLKSTWGQFELQQAHYRAIAQRKDVLILVKFDDCKVPTKLMGKTFLDWSDTKVRPHFWDRLFEALGEPGSFNPDERLLTDTTLDKVKDEQNISSDDDHILIDCDIETDKTDPSGDKGNSDINGHLLIDCGVETNITDHLGDEGNCNAYDHLSTTKTFDERLPTQPTMEMDLDTVSYEQMISNDNDHILNECTVETDITAPLIEKGKETLTQK